MMDGMSSMMGWMMGWMMGLGLLGWVLVIALLVTIVFLLIGLLGDARSKNRGQSGDDHPANRAR
jgi:uncharacterized membrane protein